MLLARKVRQGKKTDIAKAKSMIRKLRASTTPTITPDEHIMTKSIFGLGSRRLRLYQAVLLLLASYEMPANDVIPVLKGGTISTQYSAKPRPNVTDINVQIMARKKKLSGKTSLRSLTGDEQYWKLYFRHAMRNILGLAVFMTHKLNSLTGLKSAVARAWPSAITSASFKIRGSHVARPRKITLVSIDLHIQESSGKKQTIPVFDMVLGDARAPKTINPSNIVTLKKNGKTLYQFSWPWLDKDFAIMMKNTSKPAMEKRPKRLARWLEGLMRTPSQREQDKKKVFKEIGKFARVNKPRSNVASLRRGIRTYANSPKTEIMLMSLVSS